jgi:hypothetical protein
VHGIVAHLGLMHSSRVRQVERIKAFIDAEVPKNERLVLAGDFNDWGEKLDAPMRAMGLSAPTPTVPRRCAPFPSLVAGLRAGPPSTRRGFRCTSQVRAARQHLGAHVGPLPAWRARDRLMRGTRRPGDPPAQAEKRRRSNRCRRIVRARLHGGNRSLLRGGDEMFPAMLRAIAAHATRSGSPPTSSTRPARRVARRWPTRPRRGVQVRVVVDGFGSQRDDPEDPHRCYSRPGVVLACSPDPPLVGTAAAGPSCALHQKLCVSRRLRSLSSGGINNHRRPLDLVHGLRRAAPRLLPSNCAGRWSRRSSRPGAAVGHAPTSGRGCA